MGKIGVAGEEIVGTVPTGGAGEGNIDCATFGGSNIVVNPFTPAEKDVSFGVTRGVG